MAAVRAPIVVRVDADPSRRHALAWGADEALRLSLPLQLVFAQGHSAHRKPTEPAHISGQRASDTAEETLHDAVSFVKNRHPQVEVSTLLATDAPVSVLREQARTATTLVFDSQRPNRRGSPFGPRRDALAVIAHAPCPVAVVPEHAHHGQRGHQPFFVVGTDVAWFGRRPSAAALHHGFARAADHGAELRVVHVWHPPIPGVLDERAALRECRRLLSETVAGLQTLHPAVKVHHALLHGPVAHVLAQESAHSLGLIVGLRSHRHARRSPLGSVLGRVLRHARCPVIAVPQEATYHRPPRRPRISGLSRLARKAVGRYIRLVTHPTRPRPAMTPPAFRADRTDG
ncbi:universal stress protein [Streptomyces sp. NBC_01283]|uniref:universal stress protein n=1 Tax=Streptomyces sp. NBC_01283 TaxID=2903812 RepID=UPI00352C0110|nr:universal stress protein [Streptomyces sp. NBC_01283]